MTDGIVHPIKLVFDQHKLLSVHYLENLEISVGLEKSDTHATVIIESLALRHNSRRSRAVSDDADPYTTVLFPGGAISIPPAPTANLDYCPIQVRPNLLFAKDTNYFDVAVTYRLRAEKIGNIRSLINPAGFVIIKPAPQLFGRVYISYKEPQDRGLADRLFEFTRDAGFAPYMAPADIKAGSRIWASKIPAAIKESKFMFVVWTRHTPKGVGVNKEIKLAREQGIEIVPLLADKTDPPKILKRDVEYKRFDPDNPDLAFAQVVEARRGM